VDAASVVLVIPKATFISAPIPQHKTPKDPRPSTRKTPSVTAQETHVPSHNPRLAPTPPTLSPLLRRRASHAPPPHTPPHAELSHRHAHPSPGRTRLARTPARALPRPAAATPLPRHPHRTHLCPSAKVKMPRLVFWPLRKSPSYLPSPRNIKPQKTPAQAPANPRQSPPRLNTLACLTQPQPRVNTTCPLPSAAQAREPRPAITHAPTR
jgi:hypothetical protein